MNYLQAVVKGDKKTEQKILLKLVSIGKKLRKDTREYQDKLELFATKKKRIVKALPKNSINTIKSIYSKKNTIIVNFRNNITKRDLNFFELHYKNINKDIFDFKGYFKNAKKLKIKLGNTANVFVGQYKPNILRIVLSNKYNLNTKYIVNKKQIIIKVLTKNSSLRQKINQNRFKYNIKSVYTNGNSIVINFKHQVSKEYIKFFELHYKNLNKDIFDIKGKLYNSRKLKLKMNNVNKIVISQYRHNKLRIVLSNKTNLKTIYSINKKQIIIKVLNLKSKPLVRQNNNGTFTLQRMSRSNARKKTIVIDAGHGGKDSGAIGLHKRYEKVVVLKVANYLLNTLRGRGYKVYITRTRDKFIKVHNRTVLANKKNADIFISVHANAAHKSKVRTAKGIETFFLSPARSERAKRVAAQENKYDIRKMNYSSKNTLLTILNQSKITASNKLAIDIQQHLLHNARKQYRDVVDGGVREGPFWVLVGAQMPSVLVEIGYISHKEEGRRLYTSSYQKKLAIGIANGIDSYFLKNP